jgi:hypothetical protein
METEVLDSERPTLDIDAYIAWLQAHPKPADYYRTDRRCLGCVGCRQSHIWQEQHSEFLSAYRLVAEEADEALAGILTHGKGESPQTPAILKPWRDCAIGEEPLGNSGIRLLLSFLHKNPAPAFYGRYVAKDAGVNRAEIAACEAWEMMRDRYLARYGLISVVVLRHTKDYIAGKKALGLVHEPVPCIGEMRRDCPWTAAMTAMAASSSPTGAVMAQLHREEQYAASEAKQRQKK